MSPEPASTSPPDSRKTRKELLAKLQELRAQLAVLKQSDITDKNISEALRENEDRFHIQADDVPALVWATGLDGAEFVNHAYLEFLGVGDQADVQGFDWAHYVHPDDRDAYLNAYLDCFRRRAPFEAVFRFRRHDGEYRWMKSTGRPRYTPAGEFSGYVGSTQDITEQKAMEDQLRNAGDSLEKTVEQRTAELREGEERYRLVVAGAQGAIWDWDVQDKRVFYSPQWKALHGFAEDEAIDHEDVWRNSIHPEDAPRVTSAVQAHFEGRTPIFFEEYRIICRDGSVKWIADRGMAKRDGEGRVVRMAGSETDITERKRAEEALKESESRYRQLFNSDMIGIAFPDKYGGYSDGNDEFLRMVGYSRDDLAAGRVRWDRMTPPEYARLDEERVAESLARGTCTPYEKEYIRKDGSRVPILIGYTLLEGSKDQYIAFVLDITKRKQAEEERERLIALMDNNPSLVFMKDESGRYIYLNKAYEKQFVLSKDWHGKTDFDIWPKESAELFRANDAEVLRSGHVRQFLEDSTDLQGKRYCWLNVKFPFTDSYGNKYVGGIGINATDRVRIEEALRESEEKFRSYFDRPLIGIAITSPDKGITTVNEKFCSILGYTENELKNMTWDNFTHPDDLARDVDQFNRVLVGEIESYTLEKRFIHKNGTHIPTILSVGCVRHPDHTVNYFVATIQDISELKRTERELLESKQQAELYLDLMGHDISNMHQIILGQLQLAEEVMREDGKLEGDDKELLDTSIRNLTRSAKLIENVKNLQRLRAGEYSSEPADLEQVLSDAVATYSRLTDKKITIDYVPMKGRSILVNPLIKEVFNNLLDNAVKHSGDPVHIGVAVRSVMVNGRRYSRVSIEDNGSGIPDDRKEEVFHRLRRGQTKARGTGLGLYLVRTLVESFDGIVELEDRVRGDYKQGSRFLVYLPVVEENHGE